MNERVIPERYRDEYRSVNNAEHVTYRLQAQIIRELGAAEAKVAEQAATIAELRRQLEVAEGFSLDSDQFKDAVRKRTEQQAATIANAQEAEPIPLIVRSDDDELMVNNLQKAYSTDILAFRISAEHYRYLAEQVISLRTHIKRGAALTKQAQP